MAEYHRHILPEDWYWVGAIAAPDGYNGHAYVANVARCPENNLWVFAEYGRFPIQASQFIRRRISDSPLAGAPFKFHPLSFTTNEDDQD